VRISLFLALFVGAGCVLPRSTPLAAGFIPDKAAVRCGFYGHGRPGETVTGVHGMAMAALGRNVALNFIAGYVDVSVADEDAFWHEAEFGLDFVFGGGKRQKGGVVGFVGLGGILSGWGNFLKDEPGTKSIGAGYLRAGCQATVRAGKQFYVEPYFEWKGTNFYPTLFTIGANLLIILKETKTQTMALYLGMSVSSVTESVLTDAWLWTAGFVVFW